MKESLKLTFEFDTAELKRIYQLLNSIRIAIENYLISKEISIQKEEQKR